MESQSKRVLVGERVSIIQRGKKRTWTAEFHWRGNHRRKSLKTRNLKIARGLAVRLETQLLHGEYRPTSKAALETCVEPMSISQVTEEFVALKTTEGRRKRSLAKFRSTLKEFQSFCEGHGVQTINKVSLRLFDKYREHRLAIRSKKTVANECVILKSVLGWCADRKLVAENPLKSQVFKVPRYIPRGGPNLEQVNKVLNCFDGQKRLALEILAFTGMRAGECQRLRRDLGDVDLDNNWIHIVSREGAETKTGNSWKVPIHDRLRKRLEKQPHDKRKWFLSENPSRKYPGGDNWLNMKRLNEDFQKALKKIGVCAGKKAGGFTLHSLRAFFKTFCIDNNVPQKIVDVWQNHSDGHRNASDQYYSLSDEVSQEKNQESPFRGRLTPAAISSAICKEFGHVSISSHFVGTRNAVDAQHRDHGRRGI